MDLKLRYHFEQMNKMLTMLETAVTDYTKKLKISTSTPPSADLLYCRDAVVKRLEITVDGFWKFLRAYMEQEKGTTFELLSPKYIIRTVALERLINEEEAVKLIAMIEERNKTCHMYQEEIADSIAKEAHKGLEIMKTIFTRCEASAFGN